MEPCTGLSAIFSSAALVSASRRRARSASSFSSLAASASNSPAKTYRMAVHALSVTRAYLNAREVQERHRCMFVMPGMGFLACRQCGIDQRWLSCAACWQSRTSQASCVIASAHRKNTCHDQKRRKNRQYQTCHILSLGSYITLEQVGHRLESGLTFSLASDLSTSFINSWSADASASALIPLISL